MGHIPRIQDFDDASYNPFTAYKDMGGEKHVQDFYPELKRLRAINPAFEGSLRAHFELPPDLITLKMRHVAILGHAEVKESLLNIQRFSNTIYEHSLGLFFGDSVTVMDNPEHAKYRKLFQKAFMPNVIAHWGEDIIPRVINGLIDKFETRGRAELVDEFTLHFPFHFIHELMGLPIEDRATFHKLAFGQVALVFDLEHGRDAVTKLKDYLTLVVTDRRQNPRPEDFMAMIAAAEVDGERLPNNVVISFSRQLMNAGGDTSYNGFSTVLAALLAHPDQFEAVKQNRALVSKAIEEGLRWNSPVGHIYRTPFETTELAGVIINPGDVMSVILASANRDERAFERPDAFDISRGSRSHAAFGYGAHICIGQHLARIEMANALNALLDRLPNLRSDPDRPAPIISGYSLRGPDKLHVRFD